MDIKRISKGNEINRFNRYKSLHMSNDDIIDDGKTNPSYGFLGGLGVAGNFCLDYSLYVLKTTSCGLPPGPLGL